MAKPKLKMEDVVLKLAEQVSNLTSKIGELEAQRTRVSGKIQIEVTGTNNPQVIRFVKSVYGRKKYNKDGKILSVNVDGLEYTKGGFQKVFITKTLKDGSIKSHPIMNWEAKRQ